MAIYEGTLMANNISSTNPIKNKFKVRLVSALAGGDTVYFDTTPSVSESGGVEYSSVSLVHMPGEIQVYKGTKSRAFSISAKLISRTSAEASDNIGKLQSLRSWRMPYFGVNSSSTVDVNAKRTKQNILTNTNSANNTPGSTISSLTNAEKNRKALVSAQSTELLGSPPEILFLYAYSSSADDNRQNVDYYLNLNRIPVVLTDLSIEYPDDVDYIPTMEGQPFPTRMTVSVSLMETHSPREFERFSLQLFKVGELKNF